MNYEAKLWSVANIEQGGFGKGAGADDMEDGSKAVFMPFGGKNSGVSISYFWDIDCLAIATI